MPVSVWSMPSAAVSIVKSIKQAIERRMKELIAANEVIHRRVVPTAEAQAYFDRLGMKNKANLLACRKSATSSIYTLCGYDDYF